jgi:formamidopyrimidine-DNA glycosylase
MSLSVATRRRNHHGAWRGRRSQAQGERRAGTVLAVPELPEVEMVRRGLEPLVNGRSITDAGSHPSAKFAPAVEAVGRRIERVDRRGKYLLLALDDGRSLVIHLGMTGRLRVGPPTEPPSTYLRAWWALDAGDVLEFHDVRRFGRIAVVGEDRSSLPTLAALGPEPFDAAFTPESLWASLRRSSIRVKTQLLGQRVVAGVGNIYADEALWRAGIHPSARSVSRPACVRLHRAIIEVLAAGIDNGGTTLRDYRTVDGSSGQNQHHLDCYGRAGEPCNRCATELRRTVIDGRSSTWCPRCQRR